MRIKKIRLKNYRQYKDNVIEFHKAKNYDLNFIIGANGIGKTTLLNSITWCLYESEMHLMLKDKSLPLLNQEILNKSEVGEIHSVSVEIECEIELEKITFYREYNFRKTEDGDLFKVKDSFKIISNQIGKDTKIYTDENATELLNKLIPERIKEFFFFDGEQLDTYFVSDKASNIEKSIFEISQIDILKSMEDKLSKISSEFRKEASNATPNTKKLNQKYDTESKNKERLSHELDVCKNELKVAKFELEKCKEFLAGQDDISKLEDDREKYKEKLNQEEIRYSNYKKKLKVFIRKYSIILNLYSDISNLLENIREKEQNGKLPPSIDKKILLDMIQTQKCYISNSDLHCDCLSKINDLIEKLEVSSEVSHILVKIKGYLEADIREINSYEKEKDEIINNLKYITDNMNEYNNKIEKINDILSTYSNKDQIKSEHDKRVIFEKQIETNNIKCYRLSADLEASKLECEKLKKELSQELAKQDKYKKTILAQKLSDRSRDIVQAMINDLMTEVRVDIAKEMKELFDKLVWKKNTFKDVTLDDNYQINLTNMYGYECLGTCSAAERELLALSFTLALHKVSGFDVPLIIDTPVSRVSDSNRHNFAEVLKEVSTNKQLILLLTPSEYSIEIRDIFEECANTKLIIDTSDESSVEIRRE